MIRPVSEPDVIETPAEEPKADNSALKLVLLYAYIIAAAAAAVFMIFRPFFRRLPWRIKTKRKYGELSGYPVIVCCGKLLWVLAACGIKRDESETLNEFGARVCKECQWMDGVTGERLSELMQQTGKALYSPEGYREVRRINVAAAVRKAYIRQFGLIRYLRGHRRASL